MVSLYRSRQYNDSKVIALSQYGKALRAIMERLHDPSIKNGVKLKTVLVMGVCQVRTCTATAFPSRLNVTKATWCRIQGWVDNSQSIRHREMLSELFRDAAMQGRLEEIDPAYIYGLLLIAVRFQFA